MNVVLLLHFFVRKRKLWRTDDVFIGHLVTDVMTVAAIQNIDDICLTRVINTLRQNAQGPKRIFEADVYVKLAQIILLTEPQHVSN